MANRYVPEHHVLKQGQTCNHARPTPGRNVHLFLFNTSFVSQLESFPGHITTINIPAHICYAFIFLLRTYSLITSSRLPYMAALSYIFSRSPLGHCTSTNWLLVLWLYNITRLVPLLLVPTITNLNSSNQFVCIVLKSAFKNNHQRSSRLKICSIREEHRDRNRDKVERSHAPWLYAFLNPTVTEGSKI